MNEETSTQTEAPTPPLRWRMGVAVMLAGGGLVAIGALLTLVFIQTAPVTYVTQVHKGAIESVVKAPRPD